MKAYKLVRLMKDGTLASLFINKTIRLPLNEWMKAEKNHQTDGYKYRPFWHCTSNPNAPHLSEKGRVWVEVEMEEFTEMDRPEHQGGKWYLAEKIKLKKIL
jgi:hypothetical protein